MKSRLLTTIVGLICLAIFLPAEHANAQTRELGESGVLLDRIVAVVNNGVVLKSELDRQTDMIASRLKADRTPMPPRQILEQQVLERLIIVQVQLQRAKDAGIVVSDEDLNTALSRIAVEPAVGPYAWPHGAISAGAPANPILRFPCSWNSKVSPVSENGPRSYWKKVY